MKRKICFFGIFFLITIFIFPQIFAHVPYFEHKDFTVEKPFIVRKSIQQSIAVYSWLKYDGINPSKDIDVYKFEMKIANTRLYVELIGPVCDGFYENFVPWYALVGPGLPDPGQELPFDIPDGYGGIVMENVNPGTSREVFYEPFGGKYYYKGPVIDQIFNETGTYYVYVWDPYEAGGDYVMVLGKLEIWLPFDILRALIYTPMIRLGLELHIVN